ncbi:MAG: hypothetical protein BGO09_09365 [Bacteroidetes bacterium 47-18]|nr:MAG: hypothetical protein BGO09_09365 [Bacteroidetes bacterium 47-18]
MGNSPGMMIDPNGELTKDAQPVQDNGMDYAGLDAIAVRAFMDGVMSGLYNINFMFGSNTMVMASGGGSAGVHNVGQVWLPKYSDNMSLCNIYRAAISDIASMENTIGIKSYVIAPDNSIYVTYYYVTASSRPSEDGEDGGTHNVIDQYSLGLRTAKLSLPTRGNLQNQQSGGGTDFWTILSYAGIVIDASAGASEAYGLSKQSLRQSQYGWRPGYTAPVSRWTTFGKAAGNASTFLGGVSLAKDGVDVYQGKMSGWRFGYHLAGFGTSLYTGWALGGPYGAAAGVGFGVAELGYDKVVEPYVVEPARQEFNNGFNSWLHGVYRGMGIYGY